MSQYKKTKHVGESESVHLEFKNAEASLDAVSQTVAAFLNSMGGRVLIGVADSGEAVGVPDANNFSSKLREYLSTNVSPKGTWSISIEDWGGASVIAVDVPAGPNKPYLVQGRIFMRRGSATMVATADDISSLIARRQEFEHRWECQSALGGDVKDLDSDEILRTGDLAMTSGRLVASEKTPASILEQINLSRDGTVSNGAIVLFGKAPTRFFPQTRVRVTVYGDSKGGKAFEVDRLLESHLFRVAEEVEQLLGQYASQVRSTFPENSWQRQDRPRYPMAALREGVMNALIHRDYSSPSGGVTIGVYPDRIEIWNYGQLPPEIKPSDLKRPHPSLPRNPDITHVCFLRGLIDKVGRGTQKIIEECRLAGLKSPRWQSSETGTTLTFFAPIAVSTQGRLEDLNDRQKKILGVLETKKSLKATELAEELGRGVTERTVRNDLLALVEQGWIVRRGQGPSTTYAIVAEGTKQ